MCIPAPPPFLHTLFDTEKCVENKVDRIDKTSLNLALNRLSIDRVLDISGSGYKRTKLRVAINLRWLLHKHRLDYKEDCLQR